MQQKYYELEVQGCKKNFTRHRTLGVNPSPVKRLKGKTTEPAGGAGQGARARVGGVVKSPWTERTSAVIKSKNGLSKTLRVKVGYSPTSAA